MADGAGNLGFDLHRHITALISNKFLPTYSDILQFCGRASRLAPACGQQPHLTLQMCLRESTLDELLFLPSARAEAKSVRERGELDDTGRDTSHHCEVCAKKKYMHALRKL